MQRSSVFRYHTFVGLFLLIGLVFSPLNQAYASPVQVSDPPVDQVAVKLKPGVAINAILDRYHASLLGTVAETNLYFLQLPAGQTADVLLPILNADPDLYYAEPNYYAEGAPGGGVIMFGAHMAPSAEVIMFGAHGDLTATPAGGSDQWAWTKIGMADAQKISKGQGLIVAILDTGMAADHPLLNSSITAGYDFVGMKNDIYDTGNALDDDSDGLIDEDMGHGTHVAGIIVTEAPGVQVMPIRVLNSDGVGTYWEVAAGIRYAVDHGAKIINMSMSAPRLTPSFADALAYAASQGVLVVAAAGTGSGPNYPAAYANQMAVIGVGASDQNDSVAWFSGGQAADTDVFAPGVDIYSAFPYNNYVIGNGTSMSAPMVAAEAALIMSRYPDWSLAQVVQRISGKTSPVSGASVGRIDLAAALNTGMRMDYAVGDIGSISDNSIKPRLRIVNNTPENIPFSELKIRYWYTLDSDQPQTFNCDHAVFGCGNLIGTFTKLPANSPNKNGLSDVYLEVGFSAGAGSLPGGAQTDLYLRFNKNDWSNYNEANDYSYNANLLAFSSWQNVTIYRNGILVAGVEPAGGTVPATATATRTNTPQPSNTPAPPTATFARTATPVPPTAARTATPTRTNVPATATGAASGAALKLQYKTGNAAATSQVISPQIQLLNTGTTNISLAEIKIRYWFTVDGSKPQTYRCDYAIMGCWNITGQFVLLPAPRNGADSYLEIGFTSGAGSLIPGASSGQIQTRFSKNDWSVYTQTGDYSFDPTKTQFVDWNRITVYRNGVLIWGIEP